MLFAASPAPPRFGPPSRQAGRRIESCLRTRRDGGLEGPEVAPVSHVTKLLQSPKFRYITGVAAKEATEAWDRSGGWSSQSPPHIPPARETRPEAIGGSETGVGL